MTDTQRSKIRKAVQLLILGGKTKQEAADAIGVKYRHLMRLQATDEWREEVDRLLDSTQAKMWRLRAWHQIHEQLRSPNENVRFKAAVFILDRLEPIENEKKRIEMMSDRELTMDEIIAINAFLAVRDAEEAA